MLHRDKEGSKKAIGKFFQADDPESLEASWQFGIDVIERIPNVDPDLFRVVLEERVKTRPEAAKAKPEQFFDNSWCASWIRKASSKKLYGR